MVDDRRSGHGAALRLFFNEQLTHLHDLLAGAHGGPPVIDSEQQAVEHFVDVANKKLRVVDDYADKLRNHVCDLYQHVLGIAEQIPLPVELSHQAFADNALVNALFVNAAEIDRLLVPGSEVETFWRHQSGTNQLYALLTASKHERSVFGVGMLGNLLVRDVPQKTVNFAGHKLHTPCSSDSELNTLLKAYLLDRVVTLLRQNLSARSYAQTVESNDHSYQARINSLANPDIYLHTLIQAMLAPSQLLSIEMSHFRLSKLGIKLEAGDDCQCVNEFEIPELRWSNNTNNLLLRVDYRPLAG